MQLAAVDWEIPPAAALPERRSYAEVPLWRRDVRGARLGPVVADPLYRHIHARQLRNCAAHTECTVKNTVQSSTVRSTVQVRSTTAHLLHGTQHKADTVHLRTTKCYCAAAVYGIQYNLAHQNCCFSVQ